MCCPAADAALYLPRVNPSAVMKRRWLGVMWVLQCDILPLSSTCVEKKKKRVKITLHWNVHTMLLYSRLRVRTISFFGIFYYLTMDCRQRSEHGTKKIKSDPLVQTALHSLPRARREDPRCASPQLHTTAHRWDAPTSHADKNKTKKNASLLL